MPAKSQAQFRFMKAVEEGKVKKKGLSSEKATEWTSGMTSERWKNLKKKVMKK